MKIQTLLATLGLAGLLAACGTVDTPKVDAPRVSQLPPMPHPADNPSTPAKVALGAQLFADARLSGSGKMACQNCHYRHLGWTDAQVMSRKDDGNLNTRHTPSLYNVGYQTAWYWDGRATTLEGQVLAAWRAQIGADPAKVSTVINGVPGYRSQFQAVWGGEATPDNIVKTLATFFRSLVTAPSSTSAWNRKPKWPSSASAAGPGQFAPLTLAATGGPVQEARPGRQHQEDPAEGPPPGHRQRA
jgi:cytochrome c peroxidase